MLQPARRKYRKEHKGRNTGLATVGAKVSFGEYGLKALEPERVTEKLNQNTRYIAFPYGEFNPALLRLCEEIGYRVGFSVKAGGNPFFNDPLALKRDQILKKDMESFSLKLKTVQTIPLR